MVMKQLHLLTMMLLPFLPILLLLPFLTNFLSPFLTYFCCFISFFCCVSVSYFLCAFFVPIVIVASLFLLLCSFLLFCFFPKILFSNCYMLFLPMWKGKLPNYFQLNFYVISCTNYHYVFLTHFSIFHYHNIL